MAASSAFKPKAIIFDLLTALLDSWTVWDAAAAASISDIDGRRWRERYLELTYNCGVYKPYEDLVIQSAADVGLPSSAPSKLLQDWNNIKPWPEVADVLRKLHAKGYLLGVVTNCSVHLGRKAVDQAEDKMGFRFDAVITAEESGFYKPRGEAYDAILPLLGVSSDQVLFVAGSAGDVQGSTDAGMRVVWHNHVGLAPKGHAVAMREGRTLEETLEEFLRESQDVELLEI